MYNDEKATGLHEKKETLADEKARSNIRRAQRSIEGYALCNDWQWFFTGTISPEKWDRKNLDGFRAALMQFIRDERKRTGAPIHAVLVPELHKKKDGWHIHGLISGLPSDALQEFDIRQRLPKYLSDKIKAGEPVYNWPAYALRFGWVDVEPVRNRDAAARYVTKYITKGYENVTAKAIQVGKHLYYVTRGLRAPERIESAPGRNPEALPAGAIGGNCYEYDYGFVQWYTCPKDSIPEAKVQEAPQEPLESLWDMAEQRSIHQMAYDPA